MKQIDITLADASPEWHQSKQTPASFVRFYESSYGGITVVTYRANGSIESAIRISELDARELFWKLGDYVAQFRPEPES